MQIKERAFIKLIACSLRENELISQVSDSPFCKLYTHIYGISYICEIVVCIFVIIDFHIMLGWQSRFTYLSLVNWLHR